MALKVIDGKSGERERGKATVIAFPKGPLHEFLEDVLQKYDEEKITDLVFCYRGSEGDEVGIGFYWFGEESSTMCLGLTRRLGMEIEDFIRDVQKRQDGTEE